MALLLIGFESILLVSEDGVYPRLTFIIKVWESRGADFSVAGAGAKAPRLLRGRSSGFAESIGIPAGASGAYRPDPQATTELVPPFH